MADVYVSTTGSDTTGTGTVGNPYASPGKAAGVMLAGDTMWIQGPGVYNISSGSNNVSGGTPNPTGGTAGAPSFMKGYNVTKGDLDNVIIPLTGAGNFPTLQTSSPSTIMSIGNSYVHFANLILDGNNIASSVGISFTGGQCYVKNVLAINCKAEGFNLSAANTLVYRCAAYNCKFGFRTAAAFISLLHCVAESNGVVAGGAGIVVASGGCLIGGCLVYNNNVTGAIDGIQVTVTNNVVLWNNTIYNNSRHGIFFTGTNTSGSVMALGNVLVSNGGYGMSADTTAVLDQLIDYNFFYNNTSGAYNNGFFTLPYSGGTLFGAHDVPLSGVPFNNAASGDFSLNAVAGQGAAVRAANFPGVFPGSLTTGYADGGAVQHPDPAASGGIMGQRDWLGGLM